MIDKVKLIEKFLSEGWSGRVVKIVENFAEEPEIDFDRLRNKFGEEKCNEADCHLPMCNKIECYTNFLKSKHLSAPNPKQLPMKKVWTLKKEYADFAQNVFNTTLQLTREYKPDFEQYYDLHEEPDYSQVPVDAVVGIYHNLSQEPNYGVVKSNEKSIIYLSGNKQNLISYGVSYSVIKSIEILKMPENVK